MLSTRDQKEYPGHSLREILGTILKDYPVAFFAFQLAFKRIETCVRFRDCPEALL